MTLTWEQAETVVVVALNRSLSCTAPLVGQSHPIIDTPVGRSPKPFCFRPRPLVVRGYYGDVSIDMLPLSTKMLNTASPVPASPREVIASAAMTMRARA
jgi:hypothetical protein